MPDDVDKPSEEELEKAFLEWKDEGQELEFVLKWNDPAAPMALYTYALQAKRHGLSDERFAELMKIVDNWEEKQGR